MGLAPGVAMATRRVAMDGNEAVASVAYRLSEVIAIYPITPASPMAEAADAWAADGKPNLWGSVPAVVQMQSEAGAAGVLHGALQTGALATTFTASQGLLLMIPELYRIAGELLPACIHVAARSVATHALSIFGDHSDVMACRATGLCMLASGSPQEAQDFAAIGHAVTLLSRVPVLHFFDGFRTSHEIASVLPLGDEVLAGLIVQARVDALRGRALSPDHPTVRGTSQNPDTYFQAREAVNPFYDALPGALAATFTHFARLTGRRYASFSYTGHPEAERVIVVMGSAGKTAAATARHLGARGERVGVIEVHVYRPFDGDALIGTLPLSVRQIAVLDRTKEPGAPGEPLYLDVVAALAQGGRAARVVGGRYGLASKELTPSMVAAVFFELTHPRPRHGFTVGIVDDVSGTSLPPAARLTVEPADTRRVVIFGLGSDGSVGAAKAALDIVAGETDLSVQGYSVYDSKKSGTMTASYLRFASGELDCPYLPERVGLVACAAPELLARLSVLELAEGGADVILNVEGGAEAAWVALPREAQELVIQREIRLWAIDAFALAREVGVGRKVGAIVQACALWVLGVVPRERAIERLRAWAIEAFGGKGHGAGEATARAIEEAPRRLGRVIVPAEATAAPRPPPVSRRAPDFVQHVTAALLAGEGDRLPVSAFPPDGTWPVGTSQWEKRTAALELPVWNQELCIACNKCVLECPHAAIRAKVIEGGASELPSIAWKSADHPGARYTLQIAPDDCTGCGLCVEACPAFDRHDHARRALEMAPAAALREGYRGRWEQLLALPDAVRSHVHLDVKGSQLVTPLFEFAGACPGCGETPYLKLLSQLFGDRLLIANATGCSSIFGGNLPTTPWTAGPDGRGPAWENSLFEDNAEFGLGLLLGTEARRTEARRLLTSLASVVGEPLASALLGETEATDAAIEAQRERVAALRVALGGIDTIEARRLAALADDLVAKSVWAVGGDGWAYDIGFGGLDHVLASGRKLNLLVLDTEVYSNTGGQQSKATPLGAVARFAAGGKRTASKDLGLIAMSYGHVYVARIAMGAEDAHAVRALREAESFPGPSLVIAYCPCIAHGYDLRDGLAHQRLAVETGLWPLFRFDPRRTASGESPLMLKEPRVTQPLATLEGKESRFRALDARDHERYLALLAEAEAEGARRLELYRRLAGPAAAGGAEK
jgi:pyruvate-ferredoxin/flavodoxin oxidoreductase